MDGPELLQAYLFESKQTARDLAARSKRRLSESDLSRYLSRKTTPGREKSLAIDELTNGRVPPTSWGKKTKIRKRRSSRRLAA